MIQWRKIGVCEHDETPERTENRGVVKIYEIRYRNTRANFYNFMLLHISPQTRMVTAFLENATL